MKVPWETDLLRHERFLMRLASRLAGPEVQAEDLVQDTFARALERPPRDADSPGSLRAWLATVLRRAAARSARSAGRRSNREALVARPEEADDVDARLDAHAELLSLLRDLPEAERRALFLRYSEDLAPPEIAARLGAPVETVRTRLRRGRARLREQLDARYGDRATWAALMLPAGTGTGLTTAGSALTASTLAQGAAGSASLITSGVLMGTTAKLLAGGAAGAVALLLLLDNGDGEDSPQGRGSISGDERTRVELVQQTELVAPPAGRSLDRTAVEAGEEASSHTEALFPADLVDHPAPAAGDHPRWPLLVRVTGADARDAKVHAEARLDAFGRYDSDGVDGSIGEANTATLDIGPHLSDLLAHADGARPNELFVQLDHPDLLPTEAGIVLPDPLDLTQPPEEPLIVTVQVQRAAIVLGRIVDQDGQAPGGSAVVQAHPLSGDRPRSVPAGHVPLGPDGAFRLRVDGSGPAALLGLTTTHRPLTHRLTLSRGSVTDIGTLQLEPGVSISGRAVDLASAPIEGASVFAMLLNVKQIVKLPGFHFELPESLAWVDGRFELMVATARTDADGAFHIGGLARAEYELDAQTAEVHAPFRLADKERAYAPSTVELRPQAAELALTITLPQAQSPESEGRVIWTLGDRRRESSLGAGELAGSSTQRFALPPHADLHVLVRIDGLAPAELYIQTPGVGEQIRREVALEREPQTSTARLIVRPRGDGISEGMPFSAVIETAEGQRKRKLQVQDGELILDALPSGPIAVTLSAGKDRFAPQGHLCNAELDLQLAPGETRRVDVELATGGTLVLEALTPEGKRVRASCKVWSPTDEKLELIFVARIPDGRVAGTNMLFDGGPSRAVPELAPGLYRVEVRASGHRTERFDITIAAGATSKRSVSLRPRE